MLPKVPGRFPNFNTQAFYTGAHTARQGAEELFSSSIQSLGQATAQFTSSQLTRPTNTSSNSSNGSIIQQMQSIVSGLQSLVKNLSTSK